ncbi:hypothetical protein [Limnohabitans sp.]
MSPRKSINFFRMIIFIAGVFLIAVILLDAHHNLMIKKYGHTPLSKLPKIEGVVISVSQTCLKTKRGPYRRINLKMHSSDISKFGIECSQRTSDVEIFKGKPISIYYEKWLFPTFKKERAVAVVINNVDFMINPPRRTIQKTPMNLKTSDYFNELKWRLVFVTLLILSIVLLIVFYAKKTVKNYKKIRLFKSRAKSQFRKKTEGSVVEIISEDLQFTTNDKYLGAVLTLNIYYIKNNETFWHFFFDSDGLFSRTNHIPNDIAKIKWPNLTLTE